MRNQILKKRTIKNNRNNKKDNNLSNIFFIFPIKKINKKTNKKYKRKTFKRKKKYYGGNNTPIDAKECLSQGFCSGDYPSSIPSYLEEYAVTEFSSSTDTNTTGELHKIRESNKNLSVGDSSYTAATPPKGSSYVAK